ncbi:MAG: hypothetical protein Q7S78_01460 [Candidatus Azambacteria bacterium]|nr:hypothetical protein [Candidatus Azambacteria bacterium]
MLKRVFIAVIYVAVFAGVGTGAYFLFKPAAPPITGPTIYPIEIIWSQVFSAGQNLYSAAAKIKNPNTNFGANNFSYTFYFYDEAGILLDTSASESYIWPGESKYIILGGINLSKNPAKMQLQLGKPVWKEIKNFSGISLSLSNVNYGKGQAGSGKFFEINFKANNDTPYDLAKVNVSSIVFDENDSPIAAVSTLLENLKSKERRQFSIPWFSAFSGAPNSVDLTITTNLWETPELIGQ